MDESIAPGANLAALHFVNRTGELGALAQTAGQAASHPLLLVYGPNGIGKSALLAAFQAWCARQQIACACIDFARFEYRSTPNYLAVLLDLWHQLRLGHFEEIGERIAGLRQPRLAPPAGNGHANGEAERGQHSPGAGLAGVEELASLLNRQEAGAGDRITANVGGAGPHAQVAVGKNILQYLFVQPEDPPEIRQLIRQSVTTLFHSRLQTRLQNGRIVLLFDAWEEIVGPDGWLKETGAWVHDELLHPLAAGQMPGLSAIIASEGEFGASSLFQRGARIRLEPLPRADVQSYFVEQRGLQLPASALAALVEIAGGVPLAMHLMAAQAGAMGGAGLAAPASNGATPVHLVIANAVAGLLAALPPAQAQALRLAAIPHTFDPALLAHLGAAPEAIQSVFAQPFVQREPESGQYHFHPEVRRCLLAWWRQEQPAHWLAANRLALAWFEAALVHARQQGLLTYALTRELLYHQLVVDETAGLELLIFHFEQACERYALGEAQGFVDQLVALAVQQQHALPRASAWLPYFTARLDLIHRRGDWGEAAFVRLWDSTQDRTLRAAAGWGLGNVRSAQQRWSQAARLYRASLAELDRLQRPRLAARVFLQLGQLYSDLAQHSGGFAEEEAGDGGWGGRLFHLVQNLPFLLYERLAHRLSFLPGSYFGANYQDWIIAYLLGRAARWHRRAEKLLAGLDDAQGLFRARLALAEIEQARGRWSRAHRRYMALAAQVEGDGAHSYRIAQVKLGRGRTLAAEGLLAEAAADLQEAMETFGHFADHRSQGEAALHLARTLARQDSLAAAIPPYLTALTAYAAAHDFPARTRAAGELEALLDRLGDQPPEAASALRQVNVRHYVTRFPGPFLRGFRRLALLVVLPLTYLLTLLVTLAIMLALAVVEGQFALWRSGVSSWAGFGGALLVVAVLLAPIFFALWFHRLLYSVLGVATVHLVGRRLQTIEEDQPDQIILDDNGVTYHDGRSGSQQTLAWPAISSVTTVEYHQWRRPFALVSGMLVDAGEQTTLLVDAVTAGYAHLKQDVLRRLAEGATSAKYEARDLDIFARKWMAGLAAALLAAALLVYFFDPLDVTFSLTIADVAHAPRVEIGGGPGQAQPGAVAAMARISSFLLILIPLGLFVFPALTLWRVVRHRLALRRRFGRRLRILPLWLLWLAALLCTLVALLGVGLVFVL